MVEENKTNKTLHWEEQKCRSLIEMTKTGYVILDSQCRVLDANQIYADLTGRRSLEEVIGHSVLEWTAPYDQKRNAEEVRKCIEQGSVRNLRIDYIGHTGKITSVEIHATVLDGDESFSILSLCRDVTDRKRLEEEILIREHRLNESQQVAKIGSWSWDVRNNTLQWSDETFRRFDKDPSTFTPTVEYYVERIHPDDRAAIQKAIQDSLENDTPYHIQPRIINEHGREWVLEGFGIVERDTEGKPLRFAGTAQDITDRKQAEAALRNKEARFRNLFEQSPVSLWEEDYRELTEYFATLRSSGIADLNTYFLEYPDELMKCVGMIRILAVNRTTLEMFDAPDEATLLQGLSQVFSPESFEAFREIVVALFEGARSHTCEAVNLTLSGQKINTLIQWSLLPEGATQGSLALISIIDITKLKQAEAALRQREEFIRSILNTVDEGFIVVDRDYRILTANNAYCKQIGKNSEHIIGSHCYEISHQTSRPCYEEGEECATRHAFETGTPHTALHRHKDAHGNILYVETKAYPIHDASGAVISVIETINNITEKYLLEEERLKTQKLESIGTLAGGIAHDFNNLLQGVFGYISMAKITHDQKEKSLAMLDQAEEALHMSVNLTTQLLTFSKGGKPLMKMIRLEPAIENAVKFALSGSQTDYRLNIASDLWPVDADAGQLAQVIQNIVLNANEAMAGRGTVTISVKNMDIPAKTNPRLPDGGHFVCIDIQDTGTGISGQNLSKIFDPYFTTKQRGSGLGLATSYSIIKNHGGLIAVSSEINRGTTFFIYLPASRGAEITAEPKTPAAMTTRKLRVLLMDDEDLVRHVAREMIAALGHEVEGAEDGIMAIELFQQARDAGTPFDLVILDLTVKGGMGGQEAVAKMRDIDPDVKAVVSSGYADSPIVADFRAYGFTAVLNKPYRLDTLKECLNLFVG